MQIDKVTFSDLIALNDASMIMFQYVEQHIKLLKTYSKLKPLANSSLMAYNKILFIEQDIEDLNIGDGLLDTVLNSNIESAIELAYCLISINARPKVIKSAIAKVEHKYNQIGKDFNKLRLN